MKRAFRLALASLFVLTLGPVSQVMAQNAESGMESVEEEPILEACSEPEHRQFDFWLGRWEVTGTSGEVVGTNEITRVANGCALHEYWRSARGPTGTSLNFFDPATGDWHQVWAGLGLYLRLRGGLQNEKMVLSGERGTEDDPVIDRITWTPGADGTVRQVWEVSRDGGESWETVFDGLYSPR